MKSKTQMDWPVPIMTVLEFIFVIGWMKVAEVLLNPLGEDDDDFEVNSIIDNNISVSYIYSHYLYDSYMLAILDNSFRS